MSSLVWALGVLIALLSAPNAVCWKLVTSEGVGVLATILVCTLILREKLTLRELAKMVFIIAGPCSLEDDGVCAHDFQGGRNVGKHVPPR